MSGTKEPVRGWDGEISSLLAETPACVTKFCYEYDNAIWTLTKSRRCIDGTKNFKVRPDDVFIISFPKTGTTWTQHIMLLIQHEADLSFLEGKQINHMVPFLEMVDIKALVGLVEQIKPAMPTVTQIDQLPTCFEQANAMPTDTPRILKTHVDPRWIPEELRDNPKAKVVYVARNPKDTAVSLYHFFQLLKWLPDYASWDEYIQEFMAERVPIGSTFYDNVLYWWKLRDHPNVLFLKYEDIKEDHRKAVVQIAEFMGKALSDDIIDRIVQASSFKAMKESKSTNPDQLMNTSDASQKKDTETVPNAETPIPANKKTFMRKGIVGDWKNYFTEEQNQRFDEIYREKMAGSGLEFRFE